MTLTPITAAEFYKQIDHPLDLVERAWELPTDVLIVKFQGNGYDLGYGFDEPAYLVGTVEGLQIAMEDEDYHSTLEAAIDAFNSDQYNR